MDSRDTALAQVKRWQQLWQEEKAKNDELKEDNANLATNNAFLTAEHEKLGHWLG